MTKRSSRNVVATREAIARVSSEDLERLRFIAKKSGDARSWTWQRFGSVGGAKVSAYDARRTFVASDLKASLDGRVTSVYLLESCMDAMNNIIACRQAAIDAVKPSVFKRASSDAERHRMFRALKSGEWVDDPFLHRQMRRRFRRGVNRTFNQIIVRSDQAAFELVDGRLDILIPGHAPRSPKIVLHTKLSSSLEGQQLRIIIDDDDRVRVLYGVTQEQIDEWDGGRSSRPAGDISSMIGVDAGYTEAWVDSMGRHHGVELGSTLTERSDANKAKNQARNRLRAIANRAEARGDHAKAKRIRANNLGTKKRAKRQRRIDGNVKRVAHTTAHAIVDTSSYIACEDLSRPMKSKSRGRNQNRRLNEWTKGQLFKSLQAVAKRRGATLHFVNPAYTSQVDHQTASLAGTRLGDRFTHPSGDVSQADENAAINILVRSLDPRMSRWSTKDEVRAKLTVAYCGDQDPNAGNRRVGSELAGAHV